MFRNRLGDEDDGGRLGCGNNFIECCLKKNALILYILLAFS